MRLNEISLSTTKNLRKLWDPSRYEDIFSQFTDSKKVPFRLYFDLGPKKKNKINPPADINRAVEQAGYEIVDYIEGYASDGKRTVKIGKILSKVDPKLQQKFANDPKRATSKKDNLMVVISRHPHDIAGMSTDRGWNSCMSLTDGEMNHYVLQDVKNGTLVAYLINENDKNIKNPIARIAIKPYVHEETLDVILVPARIYGTGNEKFKEFVSNWTEQINQGKTDGYYCVSRHTYNDSLSRRVGFVSNDNTDTDNTEDDYLKKLKDNPELIADIKYPSVDEQMTAVRAKVSTIALIEDPDEAVKKLAIKKSKNSIKWIKNPTFEDYITHFKLRPNSISEFDLSDNLKFRILNWFISNTYTSGIAAMSDLLKEVMPKFNNDTITRLWTLSQQSKNSIIEKIVKPYVEEKINELPIKNNIVSYTEFVNQMNFKNRVIVVYDLFKMTADNEYPSKKFIEILKDLDNSDEIMKLISERDTSFVDRWYDMPVDLKKYLKPLYKKIVDKNLLIDFEFYYSNFKKDFPNLFTEESIKKKINIGSDFNLSTSALVPIIDTYNFDILSSDQFVNLFNVGTQLEYPEWEKFTDNNKHISEVIMQTNFSDEIKAEAISRALPVLWMNHTFTYSLFRAIRHLFDLIESPYMVLETLLGSRFNDEDYGEVFMQMLFVWLHVGAARNLLTKSVLDHFKSYVNYHSEYLLSDNMYYEDFLSHMSENNFKALVKEIYKIDKDMVWLFFLCTSFTDSLIRMNIFSDLRKKIKNGHDIMDLIPDVYNKKVKEKIAPNIDLDF